MNNKVVFYGDPLSTQRGKAILEEEGYQVLLAPGISEVLPLTRLHQPWLVVFPEAAYTTDWRELVLQIQCPKIILLDARELDPSFGFGRTPPGASVALTLPFNPGELRLYVRRLRSEWEQEQVSTGE